MIITVVQFIGIKLLITSIVVLCIAYDKHSCAMHKFFMISIILQCIGIKLLMISIVVQCNGIKMLMISIVVQCIAIQLLMISIVVHCIANVKHN